MESTIFFCSSYQCFPDFQLLTPFTAKTTRLCRQNLGLRPKRPDFSPISARRGTGDDLIEAGASGVVIHCDLSFAVTTSFMKDLAIVTRKEWSWKVTPFTGNASVLLKSLKLLGNSLGLQRVLAVISGFMFNFELVLDRVELSFHIFSLFSVDIIKDSRLSHDLPGHSTAAPA